VEEEEEEEEEEEMERKSGSPTFHFTTKVPLSR